MPITGDNDRTDDSDEPQFSSYDVARHGPQPAPDWVVTDRNALDTDLGVVKTGKEADVHLVDRTVPGGDGCLLAAKRYRTAEHRMFHRDAGYQEGRSVRRTRDVRAMEGRTGYGRQLLAGQWTHAEFDALSLLWELGVPVPYPVQCLDTELMMQFVGSSDGVAAPRLAQCRPTPDQVRDLFDQLVDALCIVARAGFAHGDLSPYNMLVDGDRLVLIDVPQIVDLVANPQGQAYLERDCRNACRWFTARGLAAADPELLFGDLMAQAVARW